MEAQEAIINDNEIIEIDASQFLFPGIEKITYTYNSTFQTLVLKVNKIEVFVSTGLLATHIYRKVRLMYPNAEKAVEEMNFEKMIEFIFGVKKEVISIKIRKRQIVEMRQITMWWIKNNTSWSLREIGEFMGDFDHATVLHACKTVSNLIQSNAAFRKKSELFINKAREFQLKQLEEKVNTDKNTDERRH